jgi:2-aminoadipate transaminase
MEQAEQATDLHTAQLTQMVVHEVVKDGFLTEHIPTIRKSYAAQCQSMLDAIQEFFRPAQAGRGRRAACSSGSRTLPKHTNSMELLEAAVAQNVAFVPGAQRM